VRERQVLEYEAREVRSYESEYVNGLWHLDFHHGSLRVLRSEGPWAYPILLGILDDHSRLCCHLQWYLAEGARELCHGLSQAFQKRDLPRSILFDNGSAMIAAETVKSLPASATSPPANYRSLGGVQVNDSPCATGLRARLFHGQ
jgi:hypothetical protein